MAATCNSAGCNPPKGIGLIATLLTVLGSARPYWQTVAIPRRGLG